MKGRLLELAATHCEEPKDRKLWTEGLSTWLYSLRAPAMKRKPNSLDFLSCPGFVYTVREQLMNMNTPFPSLNPSDCASLHALRSRWKAALRFAAAAENDYQEHNNRS
jgi:hypothetical protein